MNFTLNDCISRINQALNYPALSYEDVYHFFDQAIQELNTTLRVKIPTVSEMVDENKFSVIDQENLVLLSDIPAGGLFNAYSTSPSSWSAPTTSATYRYYCARNDFTTRKMYKWNGYEWAPFDKLYGVHNISDTAETYTTVYITTTQAAWVPVDVKLEKEFDLTTYLPTSWWTLFVIPYVCFKFSVRNGDSGALFSDEFTQGFQQLQSSYNVPNTVMLNTVAEQPAYRKLVEEHLPNLNIEAHTRAILENMRVGTGIQSVFGGFYETGGWGV